jgi:hypothetical protein
MNTESELDIKNLFALFGATYYHSECLHRGLCNLYVIGTFESKSYITNLRIEEKLAQAFKLTLGQLVQEVYPLVTTEMHQKLKAALEQRNFLAHHFWFDRIHLVYTYSGLAQLTDELDQLLTLFNQLNVEVEAVLKPILNDLGITDKILQESLEDVMAGKNDPLMNQRSLKKQETIIQVWDMPTTAGGTTLLFETDDHQLWQLCDVGLGWTHHSEPQSDWKVNNKLQPHLPASINPRPKGSTAWNYEFQFNGAVLWIKSGTLPQTFTWGIRSKA